jgi:hypothetical protein
LTILTIGLFLHRRALVEPRAHCGFSDTVLTAIPHCKEKACTNFGNVYTDCVDPIHYSKVHNMKITALHFDHMRAAIAPLDTSDARARYRAAALSDARYAWDLARAAGLIRFFCDSLYSYCDDTHINTALRRIVAPL